MSTRILVVDDSEIARNYHCYILKFLKYEVDTAENGMVALEKALVNNYDLYITDINMPKMDGYEFIEKLRANGIEAPVIIVSTLDEFKNRKKGMDAGANTYIVKPTEPESLVSTVKNLLTLQGV